jgi:hypothetical protein
MFLWTSLWLLASSFWLDVLPVQILVLRLKRSLATGFR